MQPNSYSEFSRRVHAEGGARAVPLSGTIEISNRCPLACTHCYNNLPLGDVQVRAAELRREEHIQLLDEVAELGGLWLLFTGGEIFARRDFLDIYEHAKRKGFLITLFTNATLIDERIADKLAELPPFSIEVTIYGRTKETYEAVTRVAGSYEKCLRGLDLLISRGITPKLKTVAISANVHEVPAMREWARSHRLGFTFDAMVNPRIDCSSAPLDVRLTPAEIVALDLAEPERIAEWRRLARDFAPAPPPAGETPQLYDCGGGVNSFALDPYGNVTMCVLSHTHAFNIRSVSFAEAWAGLQALRQRPITRSTKCTVCGIRSMCGMCPAQGELENEEAESPVEFLCHVAHLRAEVFGVECAPHGDCAWCGTGREVVSGEAAALIERMRAKPAREPDGSMELAWN